MEQEIVILEAPPNNSLDETTSENEKYVILKQSLRLDTISAIKSMDEEAKDLEFDSTIPSLMVQELLNYCYPIWDRLNESAKQTNKFVIKTPLKTECDGFVGEIKIRKAPGAADVVGLKIRDDYNRRLITKCGTLFITGGFTLKFNSRVYTQQLDNFPHTAKPSDVIFTAEAKAVDSMKKLLRHFEYTRYVYDLGLTLYEYPKTGYWYEFEKKLINMWSNKNTRTPQNTSLKPTPVLEQLSKLTGFQFLDFSKYTRFETSKPLNERDSWWAELVLNKISQVYINSVLGNKNAQRFIDQLLTKQRIAVHMKNHTIKLTAYKEMVAVKESISRSLFSLNMRDLNKHQLGLVEKKYADYLKQKPLEKDQRRIIRDFQRSLFGPIEDLKLYFGRLKNMLKLKFIPKEIQDKKQFLDIYYDYLVCPHRLEMAQMFISGDSRKDAIQIIQKEYSLPNLTTHFGFYCKICGEKIKRLDADLYTEFIPEVENTQDELYDFVLRESMNIISSEIVFEGIVSVPKIATSIAAVLYNIIAVTERQLLKTNTVLPENVRDILVIYISIYCMAIIIRMIILNPTIKFREVNDRVGGKKKIKPRPAVNIPALMVTAKNIIVRNNSALFKRANFKIESIPSLLVKAYGWAASLNQIKNNDNSIFTGRELDLLLASSVVFRYAIDATLYSGNKFDKNKILGRTDDDISNSNIGIFATMPILEKWKIRLLPGLSEMFREEIRNYEYRAYVKSMRYAKEMYEMIAIPEPDPRLVEFYDEYKDLLEFDKKMLWLEKIYNIRTIKAPPAHGVQQNFFSVHSWKVELSKYYDVDGNPQKWDTAIYDTSDGEVMISIKETDAWINNPKYKTAKFKDMKNSKNGDIRSTVKIDDIQDAIAARARKTDMLMYYSVRCPLGEKHEYKDNVCTKCSLNNMKPDQYFKKYEKEYRTVADVRTEHNNKLLHQMNNKHKLDALPKVAPWKVDQSLIVQWAKLVSTPFSLINNMGASYGCDYELFKSGNSVSTDYVTRSNVLKSYYTTLIRTYNRIKYDKYSVFTGELANIFSSKREQVGNFRAKLLAIDPELVFMQLSVETPEVQCNFLLNTIANIMIQLSKMEPFGKGLAIVLTKRMLINDEEFSKQRPLKRDVLVYKYRYDSDSDNESVDSNLDPQEDTVPVTSNTELFGYNDSDIQTANMGEDDDDELDPDLKD